MSKPHIHAESSVRIFGGEAKDYLDIHEFIDSSKETFSDLRHRALTHHPWFISKVLPRVFGTTRVNSSGRKYSVIEVGERHVLEDFGGKFIPSAQDFLEQIEMLDWMDNAKGDTVPSSTRKLNEWRRKQKQKPSKGRKHPEPKEAEILLTTLKKRTHLPKKSSDLFSELEKGSFDKRPCLNAPRGIFD